MLNLDEIRQLTKRYTGATGPAQSYRAHRLADHVPALVAEVERLRTELERTRELADPPFCRRCGHACAGNPPHRLIETTDGPVCEDVAWCTQLRHADEAFRMGIGAERLEGKPC